MNPDDQNDPQSTPLRPLEYRRPPEPGEQPVMRRLFGSVAGNVAMGGVVFVCSCIIGAKIANAAGARTVWAYIALPIATLILGVAASFSARYRGVLAGLLTGMLLVVGICIGVVLLIIGICTGQFK